MCHLMGGAQVGSDTKQVNPEGEEKLQKTCNKDFNAAQRLKHNNSFIMGLCGSLSHCKLALAFAVLMDLLGGAALLVGVFTHVKIREQDYGDLLVYTGALFVLMSMGGWVLWYSGNIEGLTTKREQGHIGSAVDRLARNLSRKIRIYRSHM